MNKKGSKAKTSQIDGIAQIDGIDGIDGIAQISWHDLTHRTRSLISTDCEPNYVRSILDRTVLTFSEEQIQQIETALHAGNSDTVKSVIYDQFIDCLFNDVD